MRRFRMKRNLPRESVSSETRCGRKETTLRRRRFEMHSRQSDELLAEEYHEHSYQGDSHRQRVDCGGLHPERPSRRPGRHLPAAARDDRGLQSAIHRAPDGKAGEARHPAPGPGRQLAHAGTNRRQRSPRARAVPAAPSVAAKSPPVPGSRTANNGWWVQERALDDGHVFPTPTASISGTELFPINEGG